MGVLSFFSYFSRNSNLVLVWGASFSTRRALDHDLFILVAAGALGNCWAAFVKEVLV